MFKIYKKLFLLVFLVSLFSAVFVFAADFEISPTSGLFTETLVPGQQVTKILTLKNNTTSLQKVEFWVENYNDITPILGYLIDNPLGEKIFIEVKDGTKFLFKKNTLNNFKDQRIAFDLNPGSKFLTFNAYFDEFTDSSYQGFSVSFDLRFKSEGENGKTTTIDVSGTSSTTSETAGSVAGSSNNNTGGTIGSGIFTALGYPELSPVEDIPEEEIQKKEEVVEKEKEMGFWNKLRSAIGKILPSFCIDLISILWLFIGSGVGILGHYLLFEKWRISSGSGVAKMSFLSLFWSECCFWWLIIGIIIGFFVREVYKRSKEEKKEPEKTEEQTPNSF
ncbi:MAG: hypothetical protein PHI88_02805 [Candidatus Pacebacteria bacterium]|nr:hypothetical protein [Candidatus Paceibacterota bacterium]